jgi:transposase
VRVCVGIDVAKEVHWATALDDAGGVLFDRRLPNDPEAIGGLLAELRSFGEAEVAVGLDVIGGIAGLLQAMLAASEARIVHVPGLAVNRAREGTVGGESKSDPSDARVIADQVRTRRDLRPVPAASELDLEIRMLVGRRRDLVGDQTRRLSRMHDLLVSIHPGLERALDLTTKGALWLLARYVAPAEIRRAGKRRIVAHLGRAGGLRGSGMEALADAALSAAKAQRVAVPGERVAAALVRELAAEALAVRELVARLDRDLEALLGEHPDAAIVRSLPGMGTVLTAEFIAEAGDLSRFRSADALASTAGLAPVLRQSGKVRFLRRANGGNKALKRVFYQSAFCSLHSPSSQAFYERKRREGKRHHQALIALARRRVGVLWAMLRDRRPFEPGFRPLTA